MTTFSPENSCIMGYNLKNARNGKNASKIPQLPSLKPLELKSKFLQKFEFSENLDDLYGNCCLRASPCSPTTFSIQVPISYSVKNLDCHKFSFFNDGGLKLGHFDVFDIPVPFLAFVKF